MYDQSFNPISLSMTLRRSDFYRDRRLRDDAIKQQVITDAVDQAKNGHWPTSPLSVSLLRKKQVYSLKKFSDELLIRKINSNIRRFRKHRHPARTSIVSNVATLVSEGVCFRLYRLDVKSFYESFEISEVLALINSIEMLSLPSKKLLNNLFLHFSASGGRGIPRGLALSATLSELMMAAFDKSVRRNKHVFFYSRYVDDIIIITNGAESEKNFTKEVERALPTGLILSKAKQFIQFVPKVSSAKTSNLVLAFEYLGYKFSIFDPGVGKVQSRKVYLDIADSKIAKLKTRIVRAIISFTNNNDFDLLSLRFKFLTGNFSVLDADRAKKRLAGIYYNYHLMNTATSNGLDHLDRFLRSCILSDRGKIFSNFFSASTYAQRKMLLKSSFKNGFNDKSFLHFSAAKLKQIQDCWRYA